MSKNTLILGTSEKVWKILKKSEKIINSVWLFLCRHFLECSSTIQEISGQILHFSGNILWFSINGPIFSMSKFFTSSTKKTIWGFPTFIAVPPKCSLLFMSLILIFRLRVFNSSERWISFHLTFEFPISVVTKLLFSISYFKFPDRVVKIIFLLPFSF